MVDDNQPGICHLISEIYLLRFSYWLSMKLTIRIIIISFLSGMGGAYTFQYLQPQTPERSVMQASETPFQQAKYERPEVAVREERIPEARSANAIAANPDLVLASAVSTPSVVYIKTAAVGYAQNDFFDFFFGGGSEQKVISSGSGVIFSNDGYIITNNHVIENATSIEVIHSRRTYTAKVIGTDPSTDLAVLKIEATNLPNAKLGRAKDVQVGEWVLAVGNPFNLESTVTAGIVSAKGRNINILTSQFPIEAFIQTDAAINPGNSGGALVNSRGELIGINTAILSKTGSYTGYGFAVPIDIVVKSVNDIIKYGEVQKAFMGVGVSDITSETLEQYKLKDFSGALVTYLEQGGAAEKTGIRKGDVILKINDEPVDTKTDFDMLLSYYRPGDKVKVAYKRDGKVMEGQVVLTNREGTTEILKREMFSVEGLGADLEALSKVERDRLGIKHGVRVTNIRRGLMGQLRVDDGFVITSVNRRPMTTPQEVAEALINVRGRIIIEGFDRNGGGRYYSFYK
jgi:serine protease Do